MPKADDFGMREILGVHFDTEFASGAPSKGGVAPPVTHHVYQPPAVLSYPAGTTMPAAHSTGIDTTFAGANTTSNDVVAPFIGGRAERTDSNVSDSSLDKALQQLEDVFTADFA